MPLLPSLPAAVSQSVLAVVELLIRHESHDYSVVADAISCLNHLLDTLQLSLSNPHQQQQQQQQQQQLKGVAGAAAPSISGSGSSSGGLPPAKRSALASSSAGSGGPRAVATPPSHGGGVPQSASFLRNNGGVGWPGTGAGSGGNMMARTASMRTFC